MVSFVFLALPVPIWIVVGYIVVAFHKLDEFIAKQQGTLFPFNLASFIDDELAEPLAHHCIGHLHSY